MRSSRCRMSRQPGPRSGCTGSSRRRPSGRCPGSRSCPSRSWSTHPRRGGGRAARGRRGRQRRGRRAAAQGKARSQDEIKTEDAGDAHRRTCQVGPEGAGSMNSLRQGAQAGFRACRITSRARPCPDRPADDSAAGRGVLAVRAHQRPRLHTGRSALLGGWEAPRASVGRFVSGVIDARWCSVATCLHSPGAAPAAPLS